MPRRDCTEMNGTDPLVAYTHDGPEPINVRIGDASVRADPGDWIVTDPTAAKAVCKPADFDSKYKTTAEIPTPECGR